MRAGPVRAAFACIGLHHRGDREPERPMNNWLFLGLAIAAEVIATSALKSSEGFTRLWPSLLVAAGYGAAFYFLSLTLRTIPIGVAYAVWSGVGVVLIALIAWLLHGQRLDAPALAGMGLIVTGVAVINLYSKAAAH
jgi:small multidrug resistance pump